jgi:hypothetical protein
VSDACLSWVRQDLEAGTAGGADNLLVIVAYEQWPRA